MAAAQKRLLTAESSRLGKVDIVAMLRRDDAWISQPQETREHLYSLLPPPIEGEPPRDPDVNPLSILRLKGAIENELRRWQEDLTEGREVKKWRTDAMQAGKDHTDGKFDEWKIIARDEYWDKPDDTTKIGDDKEGNVSKGINGDNRANIGRQVAKEIRSGEGGGSEL